MPGVNDFVHSNTWLTLINETGPTLYKAARMEFETIFGGGDVEEEDIREIHQKAELIKEFTAAYIDGLAKGFVEYGRNCYMVKEKR